MKITKLLWCVFVFAGLVLFVLAISGKAHAQDCNSIVSDVGDMLTGKVKQVEQAAAPLINQGADLHVVTVSSAQGNLDIIESSFEKSCSSWRSANGGRKSTLLVLMVSKDHKLGVYYGSAWHSALDAHWNRIKTDYMVPRFKDGDFAGGFVAAEEQLAKRLVASKDESLKPVVSQSTTVNQASDLSGLWTFLKWLLVAFIFAGIYGCFVWFSLKRKREKQILKTAQQSAITERNWAASNLNTLADKIADKKASGETVPSLAEATFNSASEDYGRVSTLIKYDPTDDSLSVVEYNSIASTFRAINQKLRDAARYLAGSTMEQEVSKVKPYQEGKPENIQQQQSNSGGTNIQQATTEPVREVVEHHYCHEHEYVPPIVVVNEPSYVPPVYEAPVRTYEEPEPTHHSHSRDEGDEDSGGGGSSSWSSGSSSDSDSGGSSSWSDSGSSDSGGGGSSDY